ncbi:hypothetical protein [uncultured Dialister sp.]|nr:hypothetical protein [uncultured Dialister sp.]
MSDSQTLEGGRLPASGFRISADWHSPAYGLLSAGTRFFADA